MVEDLLNLRKRLFGIAFKLSQIFGVPFKYFAEVCRVLVYKIIDRLAVAFGKVNLHEIPRKYKKILSFFAGREVIVFHRESIPYMKGGYGERVD